MKHWRVEQVNWDRFDPSKVDPEIVPLVKAAAMVERNGDDYALYLKGVFHDDPDFRTAAANWAVEEIQHGDALGRWGELADPGWDYQTCFARYRTGFRIDTAAASSIRGSRTGELIARCMVETGTSSYYTALGEATEEPVLKEICRLIAADEYRHFKLFYDHMKRYLAREDLSFLQRLKVAAGRIGESEDDELAFAFHCSNEDPALAYDHGRCIAGYMGRAMAFYRYRHIERGMGMVFKAVGLEPRGRMSDLAARGAWRLLCWRRDRFREALRREAAQPVYAQAA
ncbi:ferritin-like domain-containing protein [Paracraurococcus lichenis]|uniref:Ferritin-like domain-containing protein n=1 Tax=Paracraurococcus lichenis TaxID=3064888 RepID=A0ABT9DUJ6_9PROT|nr:ferritin-like domain-containing protein [Paracraurococcus sp. LOR1-02]MDO9707573.1 ferritin-like domain-containing protein [Paracraurococcus sp. LOR1-02]